MQIKVKNETDGSILKNTFNTICIWDFRMFSDDAMGGMPEGWYKQQFPFIDYVILMTFTGGKGYNEWCSLENGKLVCDFTTPIHIIENVLRQGVLPMIVTGNIPDALCTSVAESAVGWGNCSPPADYEMYYEYICEFAKAIKCAFREDVYKKFRFRIGTEMDNKDWFIGNEDDYLKLYDYTVDAFCSVLGDDIYIGPSNISQIASLPNMLGHFANGINYRTGKIGSKCDFLSFSYYELAEPTMSTGFYRPVVNYMSERLNVYPQLNIKDLNVGEGQFLLDGGNPARRLLNAQDCTEYSASWHAQNFDISNKYGVSYFANWAYTCDLRLCRESVVRTPAFYSALVCSRLAGFERLKLDFKEEKEGFVGCIAAKDKIGKCLYVLCYYHTFKRECDSKLSFELNLSEFSLGKEYSICRIDADHNNFSKLWLSDSAKFERISHIHDNSFKTGSVYDTEISQTLEGDDLKFWKEWKKDYNSKEIDFEKAVLNNTDSVSVELSAHSVALLEFTLSLN